MVAPRRGLELLGRKTYREVMMALDWNRILIEAMGEHLRHNGEGDVCGSCIRLVLLTEDYDL